MGAALFVAEAVHCTASAAVMRRSSHQNRGSSQD
jgi:hypothetical protein